MRLQNIIIKNGASTPVDKTFEVAEQQGGRSAFLLQDSDTTVTINYSMRPKTKSQPLKAAAVITFDTPATNVAGVITPAKRSTARFEVVLSPDATPAHKSDILAYIAGIAKEPMMVEAVTKGLLPY